MGFFGTCLAFMAGGVCGVYVAQNYDIPNMKNLASCGLLMAKNVEQTYRKPQLQNKIDDAGQDVPQNKIED